MSNTITYKNPLYNTYRSMIKRCDQNPTSKMAKRSGWKLYGGRGITICDRWLEPNGKGFHNFIEDMGPRPEGTTIDRIDGDGNYEPENCQWSTREKQLAARRIYAKNISGFSGVVRYKITGTNEIGWKAYHTIGKKFIHIGNYKDMNEAIIAKCEYVIKSLRP